jgi:hypothetical protein
MQRIIKHLKELREKSKDAFVENSLIKRNCRSDEPCPDTNSDLDDIAELNEAISILENNLNTKER